MEKRLALSESHAEKLREVGLEVWPDLARVGHRFVEHRPGIRVRVVAVAEKLVEDHAHGEQVGRDIPAREVGVGRLKGRASASDGSGCCARAAAVRPGNAGVADRAARFP